MTDEKHKPVLDEQTFGRLLEAAYVLQEHNRKMRELEENLESHSQQLREQELAEETPRQNVKEAEPSAPRNGDYTLTLAQIVEAQHQIQMRHLEPDKAMAVIAEQVARITGASGAGIGILAGATVRYRAGAGAPALLAGSEVPLQQAICQANVRTGQVIRTPEVDTEFLFDPEPCRQRGIRSLVSVPVYNDGEIVGALELYFDRVRGFAEQDIHTCQLMAGLVTEVIGRDAEMKLKKTMAAERSTMLAAIAKLQPNLEALAEQRSPATAAANPDTSPLSAARLACWKCGNKLLAEEQFCGKCGAPRANKNETETPTMQSKLAYALHLQQANPAAMASAHRHSSGHDLGERTALNDVRADGIIGSELDSELPEPRPAEENDGTSPSALSGPQGQELVWSSAAKAQDFLESLAAPKTPGAVGRFWRSRRGDFYLAFAVVLVVAVVAWGVRSDHSGGPGISAHRVKQTAPDADISFFDKLLIGLGLADTPETPENKGNPDTQVWVDLHTALYYCPGSELYGKTPKGKLTSQRDAQLDQFEPASRKACD